MLDSARMREVWEVVSGHPAAGRCVVCLSCGGALVADFDGYYNAKRGAWTMYPRHSIDGDSRKMIKRVVDMRDVRLAPPRPAAPRREAKPPEEEKQPQAEQMKLLG